MIDSLEAPSAAVPLRPALTRRVVPATMSRQNTSLQLLVSPAARSLALLSKSACRPYLDKSVAIESPFPPPVPAALRLTSAVLLGSRRKTFSRGGYAVRKG